MLQSTIKYSAFLFLLHTINCSAADVQKRQAVVAPSSVRTALNFPLGWGKPLKDAVTTALDTGASAKDCYGTDRVNRLFYSLWNHEADRRKMLGVKDDANSKEEIASLTRIRVETIDRGLKDHLGSFDTGDLESNMLLLPYLKVVSSSKK